VFYVPTGQIGLLRRNPPATVTDVDRSSSIFNWGVVADVLRALIAVVVVFQANSQIIIENGSPCLASCKGKSPIN
jgi:hypothetical protein